MPEYVDPGRAVADYRKYRVLALPGILPDTNQPIISFIQDDKMVSIFRRHPLKDHAQVIVPPYHS